MTNKLWAWVQASRLPSQTYILFPLLVGQGLALQIRGVFDGILLGWVTAYGITPQVGAWLLAGLALGMGGCVTGSVEQAAYTVERTDGDFQVRQYAPQVVAETVVDGTLEEAGNKAFRPLFNYISGANRSQGKIAMTAPVAQQREGEKIPMTAPVGQEAVSNRWVVTFTMPTNYTMETLPAPTDEKVRLRAIPARRMASVRYSGTWSRQRYERNLARLREWIEAQGLAPAGDPVWARYNAPFTPWFLRRNEVLVPLPGR